VLKIHVQPHGANELKYKTNANDKKMIFFNFNSSWSSVKTH